ncbi:MAG TPA: outer membrane beta-barrel protein [Cyclobacteriaceae bacterium]|nr:outer membrane beta-barrel protein [Cyclobacteriaceae bacterium]HRJ82530.1 outer membrane beta-barrel protein [Cyclobacteriaceae bacterium]
MKLKIAIILLAITPAAIAQVAESAFHVSWVTMKPTYTDYVSKTSSRGFNVGFTKFINERFGAGLSGGYTVLDDYVPRQTYTFPGGAITTDIFNYMYFYTLMANGQYYFKTEGLFVPYASLSAGAAFTEYTIFYNAYSDSDTKTSFNLRPELGALYRFQKYSTLGMKAAIGYDFVTNKSEYFDLKNFSALSFQIGIVLFND